MEIPSYQKGISRYLILLWIFCLTMSSGVWPQECAEIVPFLKDNTLNFSETPVPQETKVTKDIVNLPRTIFTVTNINDSGAGSLRDAIAQSNASANDDEIVFALAYPAIILLTSGQITINTAASAGKLKITGPGSGQLSISGNNASRIFVVNSGANVDISGISMSNGNISGDGGGVYNSGTMTISNCAFSNNNASRYGGAIINRGTITAISNCSFSNNTSSSAGGSIFNQGTITSISNCIFSSNSTPSWGGSIYNKNGNITTISNSTFSNNSSSWGGALEQDSFTLITLDTCNFSSNSGNSGIIYVRGVATFTQCTFSNNLNTGSIGISPASTIVNIYDCTFSNNSSQNNGGAIYNLGPTTTIANCTFYGNIAANNGGAFYNDGTYTCAATISNCTFYGNTSTNGNGGALCNGANATINLSNCTFSGNTATNQNGGAFYNFANATATIGHCTFADNTATNGIGGGIYSEGVINMDDNIVANNTASTNPDVSGTVTSNGYNLIRNAGSSDGWNEVDLLTLNPKLGSLADNGGQTLTIALLPGSPAIDRGNPLSTLLTDQRGIARPVNNKVDIGSFEMNTPGINLQGNGLDIPSGSDTPSESNNTDFGSTLVPGGTVVHTFSIQNMGAVNLSLTGNLPYINITGTNAGDFNITAIPSTPITPFNATTFNITFDPGASGIRTATVEIASDDPDALDNPYTFDIKGVGLIPLINIQGNSIDIPNNSNLSDIANGTEFGTVVIATEPVSHTFSIQNKGTGNLIINSITGNGDFSISNVPGIISPGSSSYFQVTFKPRFQGVQTAIITIINNDKTYSFLVSGAGDLDTTMVVAITPLSIHFGNVLAFDVSTRTITITNRTPDLLAQLSLTNSNTNEFTVTQFPTEIAGGASRNFSVTFHPKHRGTYTTTLTLEVTDTSRDSRTYINLACTGVGIGYRHSYNQSSHSSCGATGIEFLVFLFIFVLLRKLSGAKK